MQSLLRGQTDFYFGYGTLSTHRLTPYADWETVDVGGFTFRRRVQSAQRQQQSAAQQPAKKQRTLAASPATHTPAALPAPAVQPTSTPSEVLPHVQSQPSGLSQAGGLAEHITNILAAS